jgi:L-cysteate sulfo-lyase
MGVPDGGDDVEPLRLGTWPTPLEPAPRLAVRLGLRSDDLWIKRDDLTGLGGGGNKVRKLEYTCAVALAEGATTLVTTGAAQSNHARLTAAAACRLGLDAVLVLAGEPPESGTGNLTLNALLGAHLVWAGDDAMAAVVAKVVDDLRVRGRRPSVIPFGGSNAVAARGYAACGAELREQLAADPAHAVVAVGSGGTMAGLVAALGAARVLGVDSGAVPDARERVAGMLAGMRTGMLAGMPADMPTGMPDDGVPTGYDPAGRTLRLRGDQVGPGYGVLTPAARAAMRDAARCEGLILDPVYTAKALAGLAAAVRDGDIRPGERTVFVHTGGLPGLFGHPLAQELTADAGSTASADG